MSISHRINLLLNFPLYPRVLACIFEESFKIILTVR